MDVQTHTLGDTIRLRSANRKPGLVAITMPSGARTILDSGKSPSVELALTTIGTWHWRWSDDDYGQVEVVAPAPSETESVTPPKPTAQLSSTRA